MFIIFPGKEEWNSQVQQVRDSLPASHGSEIQPQTNRFEQTTSNEREDESRNNNQNLTTHSDQQIQAGNQFSTSEVQRSGSTARDNPSTLERPMENPSPTAARGSSEFVVQRKEEVLPTQPPHRWFQPKQEDEIVDERRVGDGSEEQEDDENSEEEEEEDDLLSELNENVHGSDQVDGPVRPNLLTQNSCYEDNNLTVGPDNRQDVAGNKEFFRYHFHKSSIFHWTTLPQGLLVFQNPKPGGLSAVAQSDKTMSKKHFWCVSQLSQTFNDNHFNKFSVKGGSAQFPELKYCWFNC